MKERLKKICLWLAQGVLWLFIFSVHVQGRTLFDHGHEIFVQNRFIQALDEELAEIWYKTVITAKTTWKAVSSKDGQG
jgi:hypothetical protein